MNFSGTGGGFKKFCAGETDINDASRPINSEEMKTCKGICTFSAEWLSCWLLFNILLVSYPVKLLKESDRFREKNQSVRHLTPKLFSQNFGSTTVIIKSEYLPLVICGQ